MQVLLLFLMGSLARAGVLSAPQALVTRQPLVARQADSTGSAVTTPAPSTSARWSTLGWYSLPRSGTVLWQSWEYNATSYSYTSSGNYWAACDLSSTSCDIWTSCSLGYMIAESTSILCEDVSVYHCTSNLLFSTYGALSGLTAIFCQLDGLVTSVYQEQPTVTLTPSIPSSNSATTTAEQTSIESTPAATTTSSPPPPSSSNGGGSNTGVIAGSVVGGVVALAALAVVGFYISRRFRSHPAPPATPEPGLTAWSPGEKPPETMAPYNQDPQMTAQYYPDGSNGGSPQFFSPVPQYNQGYASELSGARSPPPMMIAEYGDSRTRVD